MQTQHSASYSRNCFSKSAILQALASKKACPQHRNQVFVAPFTLLPLNVFGMAQFGSADVFSRPMLANGRGSPQNGRRTGR
jgi:hypothetical protein